jgi:hypothetical protein
MRRLLPGLEDGYWRWVNGNKQPRSVYRKTRKPGSNPYPFATGFDAATTLMRHLSLQSICSGVWRYSMYALPGDFGTHVLTCCYLAMVCFGPSITKLDFARPQTSPGEKPYKVSFCVEPSLTNYLNGISRCRDFSRHRSPVRLWLACYCKM